jgi:hypothetical protein
MVVNSYVTINRVRVCWIDLNPGPVKPSPGLSLPLTERPDRGRPMHYWAMGPRRQRLYKWARELRFIESPNLTLSPVPISRGARQRREDPLQSFCRCERPAPTTSPPLPLLLRATTGAPDDSRIRGHGVLIVVQDRRYELRSKS